MYRKTKQRVVSAILAGILAMGAAAQPWLDNGKNVQVQAESVMETEAETETQLEMDSAGQTESFYAETTGETAAETLESVEFSEEETLSEVPESLESEKSSGKEETEEQTELSEVTKETRTMESSEEKESEDLTELTEVLESEEPAETEKVEVTETTVFEEESELLQEASEPEQKFENFLGLWETEDLQVLLKEDGTATYLKQKQLYHGSWRKTEKGLEAEVLSKEQNLVLLEICYENGSLLLKDGPGTFLLVKAAKTTELEEFLEEQTEERQETESFKETENIEETEILEAAVETEAFQMVVETETGLAEFAEERKETETWEKVFRVDSQGGTLFIYGKNGQLLGKASKDEGDFTVKASAQMPENLADVTIKAEADQGYVVQDYEAVVVTDGKTIVSPASAYGIGQREYTRAHYLAQLQQVETFTVTFVKENEGETKREIFAAGTAGNIDAPEEGMVFTGRAQLTSINSPAGKAYNGTGVITCSSGDFEGDSFSMGGCASGHTHAIPLVRSEGTYTLTITGTDKVNGKVSYYLYWNNDQEPSGYQDLHTYGSYDHSFTARIKVTKTAKGNFDAGVSSEYSLKGAEFTLYEQYDAGTGKVSEKIGVMVTGASGKTTVASAQKVTAGKTYYVKETKAPKGFLLNETVYPVTASESTNVITISEEPKKGKIRIKKINGETGKTDKSLTGAKFKISKDADMSTTVQTITVDGTGYGESASYYLLGRTYYVQESSAPSGWERDDTVYEVVIKDNGKQVPEVVLTVSNFPEEPDKAALAVQKVDAVTGKTAPLSEEYQFFGAVYTIYTDEKCQKKAGTITTNEKGYGKKDGLDLGIYYLKETTAPKGGHYELDETVYKAVLNETKTVKIKSKEAPERTHLEIVKIDAKTGKTDARLAGTVFGIYTDASAKASSLKEKVTAGANGKAVTKDQYYYGVTYYIKEENTPSEWEKNTEIFEATPTSTVKIPSIQIANIKREGSLCVQKTVQNAAYLAKHPIQGAVYTIYKDQACTSVYDKITTDKNGYGEKSGIPFGNYYVKETVVPTGGGYELDRTVYPVSIHAQNYAEKITVTSVEPILGSIELEKNDSETGTSTPANASYSMDGAVYSVYQDAACQKLFAAMEVKNGKASCTGLPLGTYYVKETKEPSSGTYWLDPQVYTAKVDGEPVKIVSTDPVRKGKLAVQKVDAETGKKAPFSKGLTFEGAKFGIYTDSTCQTLIQTLTTGKDGKAVSEELLIDTYYIKELEAPKGYQKNEEVFPITASQMKHGVLENAAVEISIADQVIRGDVVFLKYINTDENSAAQLPEKPNLAGIRFTFTYLEDSSVKFDVSGEENTIVTDENGAASTVDKEKYPKGTLLFGRWSVSETANSKLLVPIADFEIQVTEHGAVYPYVIQNDTVQARIEIRKQDADTGAQLPISGVSFQILNEEGNPVRMWDPASGRYLETFVTDSTGTVHLPNTLLYGNYMLKEISEPEGYLLSEPIPFQVDKAYPDSHNPLVIVCKDKPQKGRIQIEKLNEADGNPAGEGFVFQIFAGEDIKDRTGALRYEVSADGQKKELTKGTLVDVITTDEAGLAESKELYLGIYEIEEIQAGEFYAKGSEKEVVELTADASVKTVKSKVEIKNEKTRVRIVKTDTTEEAKVLEGVWFCVFAEDEVEEGEDLLEAAKRLGNQYCTDENGTILVEHLRHNTRYYIAETETIKGYVLDETVYTFYVDEQGWIDGKPEKALLLSNTPNRVQITKLDLTGQAELPGASLTVLDAEGEEVDSWISGKEPHLIKGIQPGTYILREVQAPDGYAKAEEVSFVVTNTLEISQVTMEDAPIQVEILKKETGTDQMIEGAILALKDDKGNLIRKWKTAQEPERFEKLSAGIYILTEEEAPEGYQKAEKLIFTVTDTAGIQTVVLYNSRKPETETETESGSETETETQTESESELETQTETESQSEWETQTESESEDESETQIETENQRESETLKESESESESKPQTETESQSETKTSETEPVRTGDDTDAGQYIFWLLLAGTVMGGFFRRRKQS